MGDPSGEDDPSSSATLAAQISSEPTAVDRPGRPADRPSIRPPVKASSSDLRYTLGEEIARGGMGRVVEATDNRLGRTVALKEALSSDDEIRRRFERETRITARLEHPSIVPVHDAGTMPDGSPFYVMRKVSGQPLEALVREAKTLPKRLGLLPNLLAAANAIAHAHHRGVLHRDLKPSNILVGELGETIVIDWGLAKIVDEPEDSRDPLSPRTDDNVHTRYGTVIGTPGFMSPEQLRGEAVDARSDVYALGATLYYLLSRRPPHAAASSDDMMRDALAGPPKAITELVPGVPAELATIVDKALAYEHAARYHDAGGVAEDLDRFLKGQLVASHRYSRWERVLRFWRRHRVAVTVTAIATLVLAVGGTLSVRQIVSEKNRADALLAQALERNEALELAAAQALVASNPTAAVARVKPLAAKHWREVRAIAMAARAGGVARGLPASAATTSMELTRDGTRLLSAGDDGVIRIHDLAARSQRTVAELHHSVRATFADDERTIVAWDASGITLIDVAHGTRRDLAGAPSELRTDGAALWWCTADGHVWSYTLSDVAPHVFVVDDKIHALEVHGGAIALAGDSALWVVRSGATAKIADGSPKALAWSPDGRLGAIVGTHVLELDASDKVAAQVDQADAQSLAWQGGALYIGGYGSVTRRGGAPLRIEDGRVEVLVAGPDDTLVARIDINLVKVIARDVVVDMPPTSAISVVAASPGSHFVLVGSEQVVLEWDLDPVLPKRIDLPRRAVNWSRSATQYLVDHDDHSASWIDLRTGARRDLTLSGSLFDARFSDDGSRLLVVDDHARGSLYDGGTKPLGDVAAGDFVSGGRIAYVTPKGEVRLRDGSGEATLFTYTAAPPIVFDSRDDWVVVLFADFTLWRYSLATRTASQLPAGQHRYILLLDHGDVAVSDRARLSVWHGDGTSTEYAGLPPPVTFLFRATPGHVLAFTGGDSGYLVELGGEHRVSLALPPGSRTFDTTFAGELAAHTDAEGRLHVEDPVVGHSWAVARPARDALRAPGISADESHVYALAPTSLLSWTQIVPRDAAETIRFLDELTNAHIAGTTLAW